MRINQSCLRILLVSVLTSANPAYAALKYYEYNGNLPFIEMMLNMMTVMGILEKVPVNSMYDIAAGRYNTNYPNQYIPPEYMPPAYYGTPSYGYNRFSNWPNTGALGSVRPTNDCRSILCGNNVRVLNGLWVANNGEMLGVKDHKFLWNDGSQNYLTGNLQVNKNTMVTYIDGMNQSIPYQYSLKRNQLRLKDRNNIVKVFRRVNPDRIFRR